MSLRKLLLFQAACGFQFWVQAAPDFATLLGRACCFTAVAALLVSVRLAQDERRFRVTCLAAWLSNVLQYAVAALLVFAGRPPAGFGGWLVSGVYLTAGTPALTGVIVGVVVALAHGAVLHLDEDRRR